MAVVVDFTEVEELEYSPLPSGRYLVNIVEAEEREGNEYPYIAFVYEVVEGQDSDSDDEVAGRKLFDNVSLSPKALWRFKSLLRCLGYEEKDLGGSLEIEPEELLEMEMEVQVKIQKDQEYGDRNRVSKYFPA